jgi:hypothetical protein
MNIGTAVSVNAGCWIEVLVDVSVLVVIAVEVDTIRVVTADVVEVSVTVRDDVEEAVVVVVDGLIPRREQALEYSAALQASAYCGTFDGDKVVARLTFPGILTLAPPGR